MGSVPPLLHSSTDTGFAVLVPAVPVKNSYLTHLPMEGDGREPEIAKQQRCSLSVVTGATEYHEGVAGQLIENINQVGVLNHRTRYVTGLKKAWRPSKCGRCSSLGSRS